MYTLIGFPRTRTLRVMWMLEELGHTYELNPAIPQSDEVRKLSLSGRVPVLVENETILTDSLIICNYLADQAGKLTFPAGTIDRAQQDAAAHFILDEIEAPLWNTSKHKYVLPKSERLPDVIELAKTEFKKGLTLLTERFGTGPYIMGDQFTVPDIILGHCAGWAKSVKFNLPSEGPLHEYFERLRARPAFQAVNARIAEQERDPT